MLALLALVAAHVTALELRDSRYFLRDDNAAYYLPVYVESAEVLFSTGRLPLLNHHQYLGQPHLAMGQPAVLYPPVYLAYALAAGPGGDVRHMIFLLVLGHFLLGAAGTYLLLRNWSVARWTAVGAALLWATFPFLSIVSRNWMPIVYAVAWVPWGLLFLDLWLERGMRWALVGYAVAKTLFCFQGYAQVVILSVLFEAIYVALRTLGDASARSRVGWGRKLRAVAALAACGGLAAPLVLPMWQAKERSQARSGDLSLVEFLSNSLDLGVFARAQVFDLAERAVHEATGAIFYVGLPVLLGLAAGLVLSVRRPAVESSAVESSRRAAVRFLVLAGAGLAALALCTEAVRVLHPVPLLGSFRWPFKSFPWVLLFAALATGVALDAMRRSWRRGGVAAVVILALGVGGNVWITHRGDNDRPFGPNRVERTVPELRRLAEERLRTEDLRRGRVVSLWMSHGQDDIERFLTHNYATLAGAYHLGGYEPLVSRLNFELAKGLEYSNIWRYELTRPSLDYLSEWSVRWLLLPDTARNRSLVGAFPELEVLEDETSEGLLAVENRAAAPVAFLEPTGGTPRPLSVDFGPAGLAVDLGEAAREGGVLRIQVAPLEGYVWRADGERMGPITTDAARHVVLEVPAGIERVELVYRATAFRLGVALALVTCLLGAGWLWQSWLWQSWLWRSRL